MMVVVVSEMAVNDGDGGDVKTGLPTTSELTTTTSSMGVQ
jgi:hypothetical protein